MSDVQAVLHRIQGLLETAQAATCGTVAASLHSWLWQESLASRKSVRTSALCEGAAGQPHLLGKLVQKDAAHLAAVLVVPRPDVRNHICLRPRPVARGHVARQPHAGV